MEVELTTNCKIIVHGNIDWELRGVQWEKFEDAHTVKQGETCAKICIYQAILSHLFLEMNVSRTPQTSSSGWRAA